MSPLSQMVCVVPQRAACDVAVAEARAAFTSDVFARPVARKPVDQVQRIRRESGLAVSGRIRVRIFAPHEIEFAVSE